jgi:hypothetical protein
MQATSDKPVLRVAPACQSESNRFDSALLPHSAQLCCPGSFAPLAPQALLLCLIVHLCFIRLRCMPTAWLWCMAAAQYRATVLHGYRMLSIAVTIAILDTW